MKKNYLYLALCASLLIGPMAVSCSDDDDDNNGGTPDREWTTDKGLNAASNLLFNDNVIGNGDQEFVFTGVQTLKKGTYNLKGWVYVRNGATLTIEAGTIIKGDKATKAALIVEPGGKLIAKGTASAPIVFTSAQPAGSRRPGDWGGLIICGNALCNEGEKQIEGGPRTTFGGNKSADNSGVLSYVRVEFAGYPFEKDKEINGITFGGVGSGTQVDHVQVSYTNDDSFEWFGGSVNCKYLVAYNGWDDDFDTDNGFSGNVQYCLSVRDPRIADTSQSNGFESDNLAGGTAVSPYTSCRFSNVTFVGPMALASDFQNTTDYINGGSMNPNNGSALGKYQAAMQIRRNSRLSCFNSVALGWPIGLILDNEKGDTQGAATAGNLKLQNIWFANMGIVGSDANKQYKDSLVTGYDADKKPIFDNTQASFSSTFFRSQTGNKVFEDASSWSLEKVSGIPCMPQAGSALLTAASFSDAFLATGFDVVTHIGAFKANDTWMDGWTEFDPQNAKY